MASKQLGKLRQWAGEVISSREKTQPSSEFVAMERNMDFRKAGVERLQAVSSEYLSYLNAKVKSAALRSNNEIPHSEAIGEVFVSFGEELDADSSLGQAMIAYGRAHRDIATLQSIYALCFRDNFMSFLTRAADQLEALATARKLLESRRLAYDSALTKVEKNFKKDKDRRDAERELDDAKDNYEEVADEVKSMMEGVKTGEVDFQRELKNLLGVEMNYVHQYLEVLKGVDAEWPVPNTHSDLKKQGPSLATLHNFSRTSMRSTDSKDSSETKTANQAAPESPSEPPSRFNSQRSNGPSRSNSFSSAAIHSTSDVSEQDPDHSDAEVESATKSRSLTNLTLSRKSSTKSIRSQKTKQDKKARSRSASVATNGTTGTGGDATDDTAQTNKSKRKSKHKKEKSGVTSWVGDAMTSVMSRNKTSQVRNPDVGNFSALADDDAEGEEQGKTKTPARRMSNRSNKSAKSVKSERNKDDEFANAFNEDRKKRRVMRAHQDYSGSDSLDELSFRAGDEIIVIHAEVRGEDWWLGELVTTGKRGLFPASCTTEIKPPGSGMIRSRNASASSILGMVRRTGQNEDDESRAALVARRRDSLENGTSEEDEPVTMRTTVHRTGSSDSDTDAASMDDYWQPMTSQLRSNLSVFASHSPSLASSEASTSQGGLKVGADVSRSPSPSSPSMKRLPPPPPPRPSQSLLPGLPPPLPSRNASGVSIPAFLSNASANRSQSNPLFAHIAPSLDSRRAHSETSSPFESQSELSSSSGAGATNVGECLSCGCSEFIEDPFRGHGSCAQCTHTHW